MDLQQISERVGVCILEICEHSLGFCTELPLFSAEDNKMSSNIQNSTNGGDLTISKSFNGRKNINNNNKERGNLCI